MRIEARSLDSKVVKMYPDDRGALKRMALRTSAAVKVAGAPSFI
jgi:hypothetical protein